MANGTTFGYNRITKSAIYETLVVDDSANYCIQANNDQGVNSWLCIKTGADNITKITQVNSTSTGLKVNFMELDYNLNFIEKITRKFLENGITQCQEISFDEFKKAYDEATGKYFI